MQLREVLQKFFTEFGVRTELVRLTKCVNETCITVPKGKNLIHFLFRMGWKRKCSFSIFPNLLEDILSGRSKKIWKDWNWMEHIPSCSDLW